MTLPDEWRAFAACLNSNGVEYLIVGAIALAQHGLPRYTGDLDILVRASPENAAHLLAALRQFGFGSLELEAADFTRDYRVVQLGHPPRRIDLLTSLTGVSFAEAWAGRMTGEFAGVPVAFLGREALLRNKRATGRARDRADAEALARLARSGRGGIN